MNEAAPIHYDQILTGPLFSEPMRVETVRANGRERVQFSRVAANDDGGPKARIDAAVMASPACSAVRSRASGSPDATKTRATRCQASREACRQM